MDSVKVEQLDKNEDLEKLIAESMKKMLAKDLEIEILKLKVSNGDETTDTGKDDQEPGTGDKDKDKGDQGTGEESKDKERELEKMRESLNNAVKQLLQKDKELDALKERLQECESNLRRKELEVDDLKRRVRDQSQKEKEHLDDDDAKLRETKTELEQIEEIRKDVEKLIKLKDEEIEYLRKQAAIVRPTTSTIEKDRLLRQKDDEILELKKLLKEAEAKVCVTDEEQQKHKDKDKELLEAFKKDVEEQLRQKDKMIKDLISKKDSSTTDIESDVKTLRECEKLLEDLRKELRSVKQSLKEREDELRNKGTEMGKHVQLDDAKLRELKAEHQTLLIIRQDLEQLLRARDKENEELRKTGGLELKEKLSQVEKLLDEKNIELETVKQRLKEKEDELKNRETDMGKHVQLDDEKLRELKAEHQTLQIIRQDLEKLLRARDKENEELRKDGGVEELKKKLSEVETALAAKEEELKIIKESTHGKEACGLEIKKLKDDLEEKQTSLNVKIKELEHIKEELEKTAQKLKRNDAEIAEHLRNDELRLKESKSELDKLEIIRKDVESLVKQKDEELERLRNIIKDREKSNAGRL